jgi:WD40 repeat protein
MNRMTKVKASDLKLLKALASLATGDVLERTVVSAAIAADGSLRPVDDQGLERKLRALFGRRRPLHVEGGRLPPRAVVVAERQDGLLGTRGIDEYRKSHSLPKLHAPASLAELAGALAVQKTMRGFESLNFDTLRSNYPSAAFVGRDWLFEHIRKIVTDNPRGLILLQGGPTFGKTAFVFELIARYAERPLGPALLRGWHILRRDQPKWLPMEVLSAQLEWQLRDRLLLPLSSADAQVPVDEKNAAAVLQSVLAEAAKDLNPQGHKLLIAVDGLDEAFGANAPIARRDQAARLSEIFPRELPEGVFILVTSRPRLDARALGNPNDLFVIDADDASDTALQTANQDDLRNFLRKRIFAVGNLSGDAEVSMNDLVERMVDACEGAFGVAEWFARKAAEAQKAPDGTMNHLQYRRWLERNENLPRGIDEMYESDWDNKLNRLGHDRHAHVLPIVAAALAIWHEAGTHPTRTVIRDLIEKASEAASQGNRSVPRSVGKTDTADLTRKGIEACLEQLSDWLFPSDDPKDPVYAFRHSKIPQLVLERLGPQDGGENLMREVHALLAWSSARWGSLKGHSRIAALRNLPRHLVATGEDDPQVAQQLADTLLDYRYLVAALGTDPKNEATPLTIFELAAHAKDAMALTAEVDANTREAVRLLSDTLNFSAPALANNPRELPSQLHGRLNGFDNPCIVSLVKQATELTSWSWLRIDWGRALGLPGGSLLQILSGGGRWAHHVAFTVDSKRAVVVSYDYSLRVWNLETGIELKALEGHKGWVDHVAIMPDGKRAVSASRDCTLRVWDLETGTSLKVLEGHADPVNYVALASDGKRAISASRDHTLRVWDLDTGTSLKVLEGHAGWVNCVVLTPDGTCAVSASDDHTLRIWDLKSGTSLHKLEGHAGPVNCVVLTSDGTCAVSASDDHTLRVWDLKSGTSLHMLEGHKHVVKHVALTTDGKRAVSTEDFGLPLVWNLETGNQLKALEGHASWVEHVAVVPDGRRAVSASGDHTLRVWDLDSGASLKVLEGHAGSVTYVAPTPDGKRAVSASYDGTLRFWDLETSSPRHEFEARTGSVTHVALSPDGRRAVSASRDHTLRVWDLDTGASLKVLEGHAGQVIYVAFTPDGTHALSASEDGTLRVWDLETGAVLKVLKDHIFFLKYIAFTLDGKRAFSVSRDNSLRCWDLETGKELDAIEGNKTTAHAMMVEHIVITSNAKRAVCATSDNTLRVWDLESRVQLHVLKGHTSWVHHVALTPDGMRAVSASDDHTLRVWDLESGVPLYVLDGLKEPVDYLAFTSDGKRVVSWERDRTLRVWDLERGVPLHVLEPELNVLKQIVFTPDGKHAFSISDDHTLRFLDVERWIEKARLTCETHLTVFSIAVQHGCSRIVCGCANGDVIAVSMPSTST